ADQAGPAGGLPVVAGAGRVPGRGGAGAARAGLAVPDLPRLDGDRHPGRARLRGAVAAAGRVALRLRPLRPPGRPAVHAARAGHAVVREAVEQPAAGGGPTLIEALTYRIEAHTNADDATRYRHGDEVAEWLARDPIDRLEVYLRAEGLLDDARAGVVREEAEE